MQQAYICDYCSKQGKKSEIETHEKYCKYNPENRSCLTCKHLYKHPLLVPLCTRNEDDEEIPYKNDLPDYPIDCPNYERGVPRTEGGF